MLSTQVQKVGGHQCLRTLLQAGENTFDLKTDKPAGDNINADPV